MVDGRWKGGATGVTREERPIPSSPLEPHGREKHDTVWDGGGGKEKPIEARRALGIEIRARVVIVARERRRRGGEGRIRS